jgi:hypothetical protein
VIQTCEFPGKFLNVQSVAKSSKGHVVHVMSPKLQVDEFKENHSEGKTHYSAGDETANSKNPPAGTAVKGFPGTWACLQIRN